ncbi:hypothetical protein V496_07658 [Pseudogymnoascus sp. VKM F-4515 (FW-2607)]|nr:hypothetical protein V496_07658 [Pseudogymnoascus sp. VKM F-4515 (FW-2607)]
MDFQTLKSIEIEKNRVAAFNPTSRGPWTINGEQHFGNTVRVIFSPRKHSLLLVYEYKPTLRQACYSGESIKKQVVTTRRIDRPEPSHPSDSCTHYATQIVLRHVPET